MARRLSFFALLPLFFPHAAAASSEPLIWGIQTEQFEYRVGDGAELLAWDFDALIGTDEYKFVWRSEAEFDLGAGEFEALENHARIQTPISDFFDAVFGVRVDTPSGPDRAYGVLGIHGLAPQWFEIDADLFLSNTPSFRLEIEYEALITNRLILIPSIEFDLPFADDEEINIGAFGPKLEIGARLSYDLVDRLLTPYVGIHYERVFGKTEDLVRSDGENPGRVLFVVGFRSIF